MSPKMSYCSSHKSMCDGGCKRESTRWGNPLTLSPLGFTALHSMPGGFSPWELDPRSWCTFSSVYCECMFIWIHRTLYSEYMFIWIHCISYSEYMWFLSPGSQIQDLDPPNWGQFPSVSSTDLHPSPPHTTPPLIASPILRIHIHEQNTNKYWYSTVFIYDTQCTPRIMDFWQSVTQSRRSVNEEGQAEGGIHVPANHLL